VKRSTHKQKTLHTADGSKSNVNVRLYTFPTKLTYQLRAFYPTAVISPQVQKCPHCNTVRICSLG